MKRMQWIRHSKWIENKWIASLTIAFAANAPYTYAASVDNNLLLTNPVVDYDTYMGVNYKYNWYAPSGDWKRLLPKKHPGFDAYFGWRFHPSVALELGYDWTANKPMVAVVPNNGSLLGAVNASGSQVSLSSKIRFKSGHADLNAFIPFMVNESVKPDLIFSIGVASMKPSVKMSTNTALTPLTSPFLNQFLSVNGRSAAVFRAGLGVQSLMVENVGIRVLWRFENTARLRIRDLNTPVLGSQKVFHNGYSLASGVFCNF